MTAPARTLAFSTRGLVFSGAAAALAALVNLQGAGLLLALAGVAMVVLAGALAQQRQAHAEQELEGAKQALSSRLEELATLHSISREIVSSVDLPRARKSLRITSRRGSRRSTRGPPALGKHPGQRSSRSTTCS